MPVVVRLASEGDTVCVAVTVILGVAAGVKVGLVTASGVGVAVGVVATTGAVLALFPTGDGVCV